MATSEKCGWDVDNRFKRGIRQLRRASVKSTSVIHPMKHAGASTLPPTSSVEILHVAQQLNTFQFHDPQPFLTMPVPSPWLYFDSSKFSPNLVLLSHRPILLPVLPLTLLLSCHRVASPLEKPLRSFFFRTRTSTHKPASAPFQCRC